MMGAVSPRTATANQQIKDARRDAILEAARRVFARNGLAGTRIGDIAALAGISQGLIYHYFPNKEALFTAIVEMALRVTAQMTEAALRGSGSAWDRLERLCDRWLAGVMESPEFLLVILQAFTSEAVPEEARAALRDYGRQASENLVELIREGQREGRIRDADPTELAITFGALIQGIALSRLQSDVADASFPKTETVLRLFSTP
jgi:AcrR family transcriptional regulator